MRGTARPPCDGYRASKTGSKSPTKGRKNQGRREVGVEKAPKGLSRDDPPARRWGLETIQGLGVTGWSGPVPPRPANLQSELGEGSRTILAHRFVPQKAWHAAPFDSYLLGGEETPWLSS